MKFVFQFIFFVTTSVSAQNIETFFGINSFGTNRIIFDNPFSSIPNFTQPTEYIRELEMFSFRMGGSFNLEFPINYKKSARIGFAYEWSGFGTKEYEPSVSTWNPVPDANYRKDRYNIHQFSIPIEYINYLGGSYSFYWIIGFDIVAISSFSRERIHIGNGNIVEGFVDSGEEFPTTNIGFKVGFGWSQIVVKRIKIKIEPYMKYYIVPYDTYRESVNVGSFSDNYLGLSKSEGNIYKIGIQVFVKINKKYEN